MFIHILISLNSLQLLVLRATPFLKFIFPWLLGFSPTFSNIPSLCLSWSPLILLFSLRSAPPFCIPYNFLLLCMALSTAAFTIHSLHTNQTLSLISVILFICYSYLGPTYWNHLWLELDRERDESRMTHYYFSLEYLSNDLFIILILWVPGWGRKGWVVGTTQTRNG